MWKYTKLYYDLIQKNKEKWVLDPLLPYLKIKLKYSWISFNCFVCPLI